MSESSLRASIQSNNNQISEYRARIADLKKKIQELDTLKSKFIKMQEEFGKEQVTRKKRLNQITNTVNRNKIYTNYYSGMSTLLDGKEFQKAYNGPNEANRKITTKIGQLQEKISSYNSSISSLQSSNNRLWEEISRLNSKK